MSKKNSSVILKKSFESFKDLSDIFLKFKNKLDYLGKRKYSDRDVHCVLNIYRRNPKGINNCNT